MLVINFHYYLLFFLIFYVLSSQHFVAKYNVIIIVIIILISIRNKYNVICQGVYSYKIENFKNKININFKK